MLETSAVRAPARRPLSQGLGSFRKLAAPTPARAAMSKPGYENSAPADTAGLNLPSEQ